MEKIKIGVYGTDVANLTVQYCQAADNAILTAVCEPNPLWLDAFSKSAAANGIRCYADLDAFLQEDMEAVILSSEYATDQTRLAIRCLEAGKHVLGGLMPCETMAEAVELVEAVEKSDKTFAFAETHSYFPISMEMYRLYRSGKMGKFQYGEGEYLHSVEEYWPDIAYGDPTAWRNTQYATFYCAHSIGPILHATGLRPVRVTAFEAPRNGISDRTGALGGAFAVMLLQLENGGLLKCNHGFAISRTSIWYSMYGSLGRAESARDDSEAGDILKLYTNLSEYDGDGACSVKAYEPRTELTPLAETYHSHGGSHFYSTWHFIEKLRGNPDANVIDVYEAINMTIPGILGYTSIRNGNVPVEIPDFRDPKQREPYRHDTACVNPAKAGDQLLPSFSDGNPVVPQEVYDKQRLLWESR